MKTKTAKYTMQDYRAQLRAIQNLQSENKQMAAYSAALEARVKKQDTTIARLRGLLKKVDIVVLRNGVWKNSQLRDEVTAELSRSGSESEEE